MKKIFAIVLAAALMVALIPGVASAGPDLKGNGLPKGDCYNLNIIGVNQQFDESWTGGEGKRIFVKRTGTTRFLVGTSDHYEVLDKNGTDGWVGDPGTTNTMPTSICARSTLEKVHAGSLRRGPS